MDCEISREGETSESGLRDPNVGPQLRGLRDPLVGERNKQGWMKRSHISLRAKRSILERGR